MGQFTIGHAATVATIVLTAYGQLVVKWQVGRAGPFPTGTGDRLSYLVRITFNPWVLTGFLAALLAALAWFVALSHFQLSAVYPFLSLTFVLVLFLSVPFLGEQVTAFKLIGVLLVIAGLIVGVQR